jgi:hypothetical protein
MAIAAGTRVAWDDVPESVRAATDAMLGSPIVATVNTVGGFSPGPAAACTLADGRQVFVKAVGAELNTTAVALHRREAYVAAQLPAHYPSPRHLGHLDLDDWVVLAFEQLDGRNPSLPWRRDELDAVLQLLTTMAELGTPSPIDLERDGELDGELEERHHWETLLGEPHLVDRLDDWSRSHLEDLAELERDWVEAGRGETLQHRDFRGDNVVLTPNGPFAVDWPSAGIGAPWVDLLCFLPSASMQGAGDPNDIFDRHPVSQGVDPHRVDVYLASIAGYLARNSLLPPPPNIAGVREFQAAQGTVAVRWLAQRLSRRGGRG